MWAFWRYVLQMAAGLLAVAAIGGGVNMYVMVRAMTTQLDRLEKRDERMEEQISARMDRIDQRINRIDRRLEKLNDRLSQQRGERANGN